MRLLRAFTLIELVFVIIVLGILAAVALPRFGAARLQADIAKGRGDIATIRSAIANERQSRVILGNNTYISKLSPSTASTTLFTGDGAGRTLLTIGIEAGVGAGQWAIVSDTSYTYTVGSTPTTFTYTQGNGTFTCTSGTGYCDELVN